MKKLPILVAYPYVGEEMLKTIADNRAHLDVIVDSGAFTAWKAGQTIEVGDYVTFIKQIQKTIKPTAYFLLDKIGDPDGTEENYKIMLKAGLNPIPIFTRGEDPKRVDHLYQKSDRIGIGGLVGTKGNKGYVKGIMEHVGSRRVHWLGFTATPFIQAYRPFSCDSSSWSGGGRFGKVDLYMGRGEWRSFEKTDFKKKPRTDILERIRFYGEDPYLLSQDEAWRLDMKSANTMFKVSVKSHVHFGYEIEQKFGTKFYKAVALAPRINIGALLDAKKFLENKKII